jgi:hypothetical protein
MNRSTGLKGPLLIFHRLSIRRPLKEITLSKRNLVFAPLLGVVLGLGLLLLDLWPFSPAQESSAGKAEDLRASQAAVQAVEQVFQVDTRSPKEAWLQRICDSSTKAGCELFTLGSEAMWARYVADQTVVTAQVRPLQKLAEQGSEQVWSLAISLSTPLPGSNKTEDSACVALVKEGGVWKFDRFLLPAEIEAIQIRQKTTTPTTRKVVQ